MARDLRNALTILHSGEWCNLRVLTANVVKSTGGKVMELAKCRICRNKPVDIVGKAAAGKSAIAGDHKKDPQHNLHFTRNVELQNKQIIKVHPILITHINNAAVL